MSTIAAYAHADGFTVTFNPGVLADAAFFNIADNILMVEAEYDATKSLARVVGSMFESFSFSKTLLGTEPI